MGEMIFAKRHWVDLNALDSGCSICIVCGTVDETRFKDWCDKCQVSNSYVGMAAAARSGLILAPSCESCGMKPQTDYGYCGQCWMRIRYNQLPPTHCGYYCQGGCIGKC